MVNLTEDFYLDSDSYQFILKKKLNKKDKNGKEQYTVIGYYSSLEHSVKGLINYKQLDWCTKNIELKELIDNTNKLRETVETMLRGSKI